MTREEQYEVNRDEIEYEERAKRAIARSQFEHHVERQQAHGGLEPVRTIIPRTPAGQALTRLAALEQKVADLELRLSELSYRVAV